MEIPSASFIFSSAQLSVFKGQNSTWLHITTSGGSTLVHKFDMAKASITFSSAADDKNVAIWKISSGFTSIEIKKKTVSGDDFKGSVSIKAFGFLPIYWCRLSGKTRQFDAMALALK